MGGKTVVLCLTVLVYIATANSYVVVVPIPDPNNSVETQNNENEGITGYLLSEGDSSNLYNWYSVATSDEADSICGTTDKEYKYFEGTQSCYRVHTERATWSDAEDTCTRDGGHLAIVNSPDEAQILAGQFPSGFRVIHIGFNWIEDFNIWVTTSGQTLAEAGYANWAVGEPNNITGDQYCGSMYPDGSFDDIACSDKTAFICEKKTFHSYQHTDVDEPATEIVTEFDTTTDNVEDNTLGEKESSSTESSSEPTSVEDLNVCGTSDSEYKFLESTKSCYKFHTNITWWYYAKVTCAYEGGHLVVINSQDEADFIKKHISPDRVAVWLGIYEKDASWITVQGQTLAETGYQNWFEGMTEKAAVGNCGFMFFDGSFGSMPCSFLAIDFICEKDSITTETDNTLGEKESSSTESSSEASVEDHNDCGTADSEYLFFDGTKSCYKVHTDRKTWNDAEATCVREGGHLAVVNSQDEVNFFLKHLPMPWSEVYLGFQRKEGSWVTIQGQSLAETGYENWYQRGAYKFGVDYCGTLFYIGTFNYISCDHEGAFICEKNPKSQVLPATTEVPSYFDTTGKDDTTEEEKTSVTVASFEPTSIESHNECGSTDTEYKFFESTKSCYKVHTNSTTWYYAQATCAHEGGHLVVINSQDEADFIKKHISSHSISVWVGFYEKDASWITIHGQTLAEAGYDKWFEGKTEQATVFNCGTMFFDGTFQSLPCYYSIDFICEKDSNSQLHLPTQAETNFVTREKDYSEYDTYYDENPSASEDSIKTDNKCGTTDSEYIFYESTRSCYKVHTDRATWNDAEATCVREGGHLAVINSQDEADILIKKYPEGAMHVYVGFSYRKQDSPNISDMFKIREDGEWLTIDGQTLSEAGFENWTPGEPNNAGGREYCGTIYGNGKFDDTGCYNEFDFICEIKTNLL